MRNILLICNKEIKSYFASPIAYLLMAFFGLIFGFGFFTATRDFVRFSFQAQMMGQQQPMNVNDQIIRPLLGFASTIALFLVPMITMRLIAEEKRTGTIELLFTLPITTLEAVLGKFLAAWAFLALAILLSFPMIITVAFLGKPDWGVLVTGYLGSILAAGAYMGVCSLTSALTKNQVISFILSALVCFVIVLLGWSVFNGALGAVLPQSLVDLLANFSFTTHFEAFTKGIVDPKDVVYFLSVTAFALFLNVVALER